MNEQDSDNRTGTDRNITRRKFVSTTAAGSAALLTGGLSSLLRTSAEANPAQFIEATIPELQGLMTFGVLTSLELTRGYLRRIERLNPLLHAVIETNPDAERAAERLDQERSNDSRLARAPRQSRPSRRAYCPSVARRWCSHPRQGKSFRVGELPR